MTSRPNILYILSDQHRGQAMGHVGDPNLGTPAMDLLAREGVSFRRAYANCPICTPSRGTIFSGRHAHAGPVQGFGDGHKATAPSTASILRGAGCRSRPCGKWKSVQFGPNNSGNPDELVRPLPDFVDKNGNY